MNVIKNKLSTELKNIESAKRVKTSGTEECVMKIWGAAKGFTGFAHMMTHYLITCR